MPDQFEFAVVVLAGGQSRRMGADKGQLEIDGLSLLERTVALVQRLGAAVFLAAGSGAPLPQARVTQCADGPGQGPASGILGAARLAPTATLLAVAHDLPLLTLDLLRAVLREAQGSSADIAVPLSAKQLHPLTATYSPRAIAHLERCVGAGHFGLTKLINEVCHHPDPTLAVHQLDAERLGFEPARLDRELTNCNTPDDWRRIQALLA